VWPGFTLRFLARYTNEKGVLLNGKDLNEGASVEAIRERLKERNGT
jgi:hypothetical protein